MKIAGHTFLVRFRCQRANPPRSKEGGPLFFSQPAFFEIPLVRDLKRRLWVPMVEVYHKTQHPCWSGRKFPKHERTISFRWVGWSPLHCARSRVETNPNHQSRITRQEAPERVSPNPENLKPGGVPAVQGDCLLRAALHLPSGEERHYPQAAVHRGDPEQGKRAQRKRRKQQEQCTAFGFFSGGLVAWRVGRGCSHRAPVVLQVKPHS